MKNLLDDLQNSISKQTDLYNNLLDVLRKEKEIIKKNSVDELNKNNKKKEVAILQIKLLDESYSKILEKVYRSLPASPDPPSLTNLLKTIHEPYRARIERAYLKLVSLAKAVKELNSENERLIKGSLRAIKSSISFLAACASSANTCYESSGQIKSDNLTVTLFNEEA